MIRLRNLTLRRGARVLLDQADLVIAPGERLALIGPNGCGKSTLLDALAGDLAPDGGTIESARQMRINRLTQSLPHSIEPAWRFVLEADQLLATAYAALAQAQASDDGNALALAHDQLIQLDATSAPARARELLHGLGFSAAQTEAPVNQLSGGWRMRLNVACALMAPCDLLLLDEPTNHLDIDAIVWLERRLIQLSAAVIIVSHDRDFLDATAQGTLHIDQTRLVRYNGGYSACEDARAERAAQQERMRTHQQQQRAHLQSFVDRFKAQASKARQAQSRLKALARMDVIAPLRRQSAIHFTFAPIDDCPDPLVHVEEVTVGYAATPPLLRDINLTIGRGTRLGILGRNGAGKTTLIRTLVGELAPINGTVSRARGIRIGYFAQQQVDALRSEDSALTHMQRLAPTERDLTLRNWLGRFAFQGDDATRPVGPMSGGERARLALAMLVWQQPQLLILDEPTNHLDAETRDALADALTEFEGALLLVSHDRYILRQTVDSFIHISGPTLEPFTGDLEDYARLLLTPSTTALNATASQAPGDPQTRRAERRAAQQQRTQALTQRNALQRTLRTLEHSLSSLEKRLTEIDTALAQPGAYQRVDQAISLTRERAQHLQTRTDLEDQWLSISTEIEVLGKD